MSIITSFLIPSAIFIGVGYAFYEPIPQGLDKRVLIRIRLIILRLMLYSCSLAHYLGYSKGTTLRNVGDNMSRKKKDRVPPSVTTENKVFDGVRVRIYTQQQPSDNRLRRGILLFHGGGWVMGGLDMYDALCSRFAIELNSVVVAVDYRMAPEHVYPVAVEDAETATRYFLKNAQEEFGVDLKRIALFGDSAGANLAAVVCLRLKDNPITQPKLQVLNNAIFQVANFNTPSYQANASGPLISRSFMTFFSSNYLFGHSWYKYVSALGKNNHLTSEMQKRASVYMHLKDLPDGDDFKTNYKPVTGSNDSTMFEEELREKILDPSLSPLFAEDVSGVAPAYIVTSQFDVLRDEGFFYAKRLRDAGVKVCHHNIEKGFHGWLGFRDSVTVFKEQFAVLMQYIDENL